MPYDHSILFDNTGYVSIAEYVKDIQEMRDNGPWKIPFGVGDTFHFYLLLLFSKISWFSDIIFIRQDTAFSPAYSILLAFLKKKGMYDFVINRSSSRRGYYSYLLEKKVEMNGSVDRIYGQGVSTNKSTALSIAIGEMLERAITGWGDANHRVVYSSAAGLLEKNKKIAYPPLFHGFLDVQKSTFPSLQSDPMHISMSWVEGEDARTGEVTYIPRKLTSWLKERQNGAPTFVHATTNGSAGYFSKQDALLRGLFEVVQRDGFLVHWLTQIAPEVIEIDTLPKELHNPLLKFKEDGIDVCLLNITSLGIPSVALVGVGKSVTGEPQVCISAGCSLTFDEAIESATRELTVVLEMLAYEKDEPIIMDGDSGIEPFVSNLGKTGRQIYWRGEEKVKQFEWFISGKKISYKDLLKFEPKNTAGSSRSKIDICLRALEKFGEGYEPVVYYPSNITQSHVGFYVAQVFIPKAFPFYLVEKYGTFQSKRLSDFSLQKGVDAFVLNTNPHMFS